MSLHWVGAPPELGLGASPARDRCHPRRAMGARREGGGARRTRRGEEDEVARVCRRTSGSGVSARTRDRPRAAWRGGVAVAVAVSASRVEIAWFWLFWAFEKRLGP
jgi:hypothetical protein